MPMQITKTTLNGIDTKAVKNVMDQVSQDPSQGIVQFNATSHWKGGAKCETHIDGWELSGQRLAKDFTIHIDEPNELFGSNTAPNPQETLMAAVNACMMATYVACCAMRGIELEHLEIEMKGQLDLRGFLGLDESVKPGYDELEYIVRIKGNGTAEQFNEIHQWVMQTSPNYWNMANPIRLTPRLVVE